MGDLIGHVTDVSGKDPNERAYRNSLELPLHTDLSDMIAMLSIRASKEGGLSLYSSVAAVHNELLASNPELLPPSTMVIGCTDLASRHLENHP